MVLSCSNICKSFGTDVILDNVSFHVNEHEKAAIVGINGAGKSTLLKIIVGELSADSGSVVIAKSTTVGYLSQQQDLTPGNTIWEEVLSVKADILATEENIRRLEHHMKEVEGGELETLLKQYTQLTHRFENENGYAVKSEVTGVLKGLGFSEEDFGMKVETLSGGQKTRVALSKLLLRTPDIIMLDEPTNHLDLESIRWLEGFLSSYKGAVILVAHDRYFLDKIVTKVVEIENTHAETFMGNYTTYSEKKQAERYAQYRAYMNQQREIKHQEKVIETLRSYNREKSIKRAESREKMLNKIERVDKPIELNDKMNIILEPNIQSGNDVLTVKHLSKGFDGVTLFDDVNFEVKRGDRIAIIGNNGTGKTTMLKIINGILPPDSGEYKPGAKVYIGYYDQEHHVLDPAKSIFDEIQSTYPDIDNTRVRNLLAAFLFTGDDVFKLIGDLSGGEKARVSLAKLMLSDANFLILDEPTNHLDIVSKEILEQAVASYTGTVVYVSHDRYFINKTATRVFELTDKRLVQYEGNYDYYLDKRDAVMNAAYATGSGRAVVNTAPSKSGSASAADTASSKNDWETQKKLAAARRKLENDFAACEKEINALEARNTEIDALFEDPDIATNSVRLRELTEEKSANEAKLEELMQTWEDLYEKLNDTGSSVL
ncbi:MAG: ABC-F family ATP-binding cassette domain-containing protein [Lachnospiraceae bacterium]|nr:ABC-F family ATP-binding cassette domain-containing protein [Lachnospiraceae bacterium]